MPGPRPVVHLELHTSRLRDALEFYGAVFGWRGERLAVGSTHYTALSLGGGPGGMGGGLGGGIVECSTPRALWLPYVDVDDVYVATRRALELGAELSLPPREGVAGWRSVVRTPSAGEVALWQAKEPARQAQRNRLGFDARGDQRDRLPFEARGGRRDRYGSDPRGIHRGGYGL